VIERRLNRSNLNPNQGGTMSERAVAEDDLIEVATVGSRPGRRGMTLYAPDAAVDLFASGTMSGPEFPAEDADAIAAEGLDLSASGLGYHDLVLFRGEGEDGFSLVRAWFAPHYVLPRHTHDADCLYYLEKGSIVMGARVVEAGSGFFVPADAPYAFQAGPEGAVVLEFRQRTGFDMKMTPGQIARFRMMAEVGATNAERWAELRKLHTGS
jgi:quercetin dioxygenase-like cupin family protein